MFTNVARQPVAMITGAAKRLGAAIAYDLHQHGYNVVLHCRKSVVAAQDLCDELNRRCAGSAAVMVADLQSDDDIKSMVQGLTRLDILVNNASEYAPNALGLTSQAQWDALVDSNVRGHFFLIQEVLPLLRASEGAIVNLLDIYATRPLIKHSVYGMAKAALLSLTRSLALELAPHVRVNGVAPGYILGAVGGDREDLQFVKENKAKIAQIPMKRSGRVEDITTAVRFLATGASFITGQVIAVDGGRTLT